MERRPRPPPPTMMVPPVWVRRGFSTFRCTRKLGRKMTGGISVMVATAKDHCGGDTGAGPPRPCREPRPPPSNARPQVPGERGAQARPLGGAVRGPWQSAPHHAVGSARAAHTAGACTGRGAPQPSAAPRCPETSTAVAKQKQKQKEHNT